MSVRYYTPGWTVTMVGPRYIAMIRVTTTDTGAKAEGYEAHTGISEDITAWWTRWGGGDGAQMHTEITVQRASRITGIPMEPACTGNGCIEAGVRQGRAYAQVNGKMFYLISPAGEPVGITVTRLRKSLKANKIRVLRGTCG